MPTCRRGQNDVPQAPQRKNANAIALEQSLLTTATTGPFPKLGPFELESRELELEAGETRPVTIAFTAPAGFHGRQQINITAFAGNALLGGVTVAVEGSN